LPDSASVPRGPKIYAKGSNWPRPAELERF
jgi:hypothetical protein